MIFYITSFILILMTSLLFHKRLIDGKKVIYIIAFTIPIEVSKLLFSMVPESFSGANKGTYSVLDFSRFFMLVLIFKMVYDICKKKDKLIKPNKILTIFMTGLLLIYFGSFFVSLSYKGLLIEALRLIIHFIFILGILMYLKSMEDIEKLMNIILICGTIISVLGILQYITGIYIWYEYLSSYVGGRRINSLMGDTNILGRYASIWLLIAVYKFIKGKDVRDIIYIFLNSLCIIFTFSRGALVALFLILIINVILTPFIFNKNLKKKAYLTFIVISILFVSAQYLPGIKSSVTQRTADNLSAAEASEKENDTTNASAGGNSFIYRIKQTTRGYLVYAGLEMFKDHPVFGVGVKNYTPVLYKGYRYCVPKWAQLKDGTIYNPGCNTYIATILSEEGIVGFLLFLMLVIYYTKYYHIILKSKEERLKYLYSISYLSTIIIFISSQTESRFYEDSYLWLFISVCTIVIIIYKNHKTSSNQISGEPDRSVSLD